MNRFRLDTNKLSNLNYIYPFKICNNLPLLKLFLARKLEKIPIKKFKKTFKYEKN